MRLLGIADDLTGALEAGALLGAAVRFEGPLTDTPAAVIDSESRHLSPDGAAKKLFALRPECRRADLIYKKTDSTLRGNIAAEIQALTEISGGCRTAYIPAYPAMGRTVRKGSLYVHGIPLEATQFARDPLNPVTSGATFSGPDCEVFDGATDDHVADSVRIALSDTRFRIIAGPASVAKELARQLNLNPPPLPQFAPVHTCLVVNGSLHDMSAQQIRSARESGLLRDGWQESASRIGIDVASVIRTNGPDVVIIFGGDTAFDAVRALGCPTLHPMGELITGIPISRIESRRTLLITKAGGFGSSDLLMTIKKMLNDRS